jgi:transposase
VFVGIDIAQKEHRVAVLGAEGEALGRSFSVEASRSGFEALLERLRKRDATPDRSVVGLEATGHLWENLEAYLRAAGYSVVVLNPVQTRRYRDVLRKKAKTDDIDAYVIAGLLRSGEAEAGYVPDEQIQSLRELCRLRARLMRDRQDYLRQLTAQLGVALPEHRQLLGTLTTVRAQALLAAFPTAVHLAKATPKQLLRAVTKAGGRGWSLDDARRLRAAAKQSTFSGKAAEARGQVIRTLVAQMRGLDASIDELDATMRQILDDAASSDDEGPADAELLQSLPGVGPQTAATLLGELGHLDRFHSARALVAYVGFYPIIADSGERSARPRLCRTGSRVVRHALYMAAVNAMKRCPEMRTLYLRKRSQGKAPKQALIAVAVKLLHTAYALITRRAHFDPSRLLVAPQSASFSA